MPEPSKELPAFPNEADPGLESTEALQQQLKELQQSVKKLEEQLNPSIKACVAYSVAWFILVPPLLAFPGVLMTYVIPKFKTIFSDMLGPGETLPEFTLLVLKISDNIQNNALIILPLGLLLCLGLACFMGFKERYISQPLCRIIDLLPFLLFSFVLLLGTIAMFLPLIKMMDKLGQ